LRLFRELVLESSVTSIEEDCDSRNDSVSTLTMVSKVQIAEQLFPVKVEVDWSRHSLFWRVRIILNLGNPTHIAVWKLDNLRLLSSDFDKLLSIECTTLQPKTIDNDCSLAT